MALPPGAASAAGQEPDQEETENAGDYPEDQDLNENLSRSVEQAGKDAYDKAFKQGEKTGL